MSDEFDTSNVLGVFMLGFIDFDIDIGTKMTCIYPEDATLEPAFTFQHLANCSLPDGAHLHQTDQSYLILPTKMGTKYGIAFFRNKSDKSVKRGAIQRAILVVSDFPHFHFFEQPVYEMIEYSMTACDEKPVELLEMLFNAFKIEPSSVITTSGFDSTSHHVTVKLFDHPHKLIIPASYCPGQFAGTSLLDLVRTLTVHTLTVWYYLLQRKRILFIGDKAQSVGGCCLASCLLLLPLEPLGISLAPYITLYDIDRLLKGGPYVAGTTNILFYQREAWYDLAIYLPDLSVKETGKLTYKPSKDDKVFISRMVNQVASNPSEKWLRDQFQQFTLQILCKITFRQLNGRLQKDFGHIKDEEHYKAYIKSAVAKEQMNEFVEKNSIANLVSSSGRVIKRPALWNRKQRATTIVNLAPPSFDPSTKRASVEMDFQRKKSLAKPFRSASSSVNKALLSNIKLKKKRSSFLNVSAGHVDKIGRAKEEGDDTTKTKTLEPALTDDVLDVDMLLTSRIDFDNSNVPRRTQSESSARTCVRFLSQPKLSLDGLPATPRYSQTNSLARSFSAKQSISELLPVPDELSMIEEIELLMDEETGSSENAKRIKFKEQPELILGTVGNSPNSNRHKKVLEDTAPQKQIKFGANSS